jgi:hypothetical protein
MEVGYDAMFCSYFRHTRREACNCCYCQYDLSKGLHVTAPADCEAASRGLKAVNLMLLESACLRID